MTPNDTLTPSGWKRKEEILRSALSAARGRRRFRLARRWGLGILACALLGVGLSFSRPWLRPTAEMGLATTEPTASRSPSGHVIDRGEDRPTLAIRIVNTDPTLVEQWSPAPQEQDIRIITDRELLDLLAERGTPAGIARVGEETFVLYHQSPQIQ
ncbi:MAG TPA: hypothetical protein VIY86_07165 [Pirellulaceae bacterium]